MCGVAGAFLPARRSSAGADDDRSHRPSRAGRGWVYRPVADASVQLGHRRLSIIDLSTAADQPFVKDGLHLSYNGELYNYRELRNILRGKGVQFSTESDTEVVLECWRHWGPAALPRFRGMFAFALYDERTAALTLVRDPLGIKPMYVMPRGSGILFASELKALVAAVGPELTVDPDGLVASTLFYFLPEEQSRRQGGLQASRRIVGRMAGRRQHRPGRYWDPAEEALAAAADPAAQLEAVLEESVAAHMVADVPVASFLSGGLDSSLITAMAANRDPLDRGLHHHIPSRGSASRGDARRRHLRPQDGGAPWYPTARDRDQPGRRGHAAAGCGRPRRAHRRPWCHQHRAHVPGRPGSRRQGACCREWARTSCSVATASTWPAFWERGTRRSRSRFARAWSRRA